MGCLPNGAVGWVREFNIDLRCLHLVMGAMLVQVLTVTACALVDFM